MRWLVQLQNYKKTGRVELVFLFEFGTTIRFMLSFRKCLPNALISGFGDKSPEKHEKRGAWS